MVPLGRRNLAKEGGPSVGNAVWDVYVLWQGFFRSQEGFLVSISELLCRKYVSATGKIIFHECEKKGEAKVRSAEAKMAKGKWKCLLVIHTLCTQQRN